VELCVVLGGEHEHVQIGLVRFVQQHPHQHLVTQTRSRMSAVVIIVPCGVCGVVPQDCQSRLLCR
jgi:hypothetical protein